MYKSGFIAIRNQADSATLQLYFLDVIQDSYDWFFDETISKVQEIIDKVNYYKPSKIICTIDSVGGDAQVGMSIYNFLKAYQAKIEVEIIGLAGSIAAVLAQAANKGKLRIARNGFMMIHEASGICVGTASEIRQQADVVEKYTGQCADIFAQRTGKSKEDILALFAGGDYWMTGQEAVDQGFADETFNDVPVELNIAARLDTSVYKNIPAAIRAQLKPSSEEDPQTNKILSEMAKLGDKIVNLFKSHKPAANADVPTVLNQVGEIMKPALDEFETEIESSVRNQVSEEMKGDSVEKVIENKITATVTAIFQASEGDAKTALDTTIKNVVEDAVKDYKTKVDDLEKKNKELVQEITNIKGNKSNPGDGGDKDEVKAIGKWNK
jgi:ATP-dependent Clp protease protease subunit